MENASKPGLAFLPPPEREFFEALAPQVQVFRGCSRPRIAVWHGRQIAAILCGTGTESYSATSGDRSL